MTELRYLSLFSGIGGLEHPSVSPLLFCEQDSACQGVLRRRHPGVSVYPDVTQLHEPPRADIVAGGWPCQDLSSAGTLGGITARRSGLFFEMLRVAKASGAHTLVGENVPNLLTINRGRDFQVVLDALVAEGYRFIAWRVLNARAFGLPQERRRLFVVASTERERAAALHCALPELPPSRSSLVASGFYWTGGKRSICFSSGYVPALKIGATDNKGRAPVAIMLGGRVRKLSPLEFLGLQGFRELPTEGVASSTILRMAGNAVPVPMGHFVLSSVVNVSPMSGVRTAFGLFSSSGMFDGGLSWVIDHKPSPLATNLVDFVNPDADDSLSAQAAAGLIVRSVRSRHPMPRELFAVLWRLAADRSGKLKASRGNSFEALDRMTTEVEAYRDRLPTISEYHDEVEDEDLALDSDEERTDD
jgi:DNA (cytosine-5)-methyltransferase 1